MKNLFLGVAVIALSVTAFAQDAAPSPGEIVAAAPQSDWLRIPADDLLVMDLAPDAEGNPRRVVIQLMPEPFSQGWVHNIKLLARSHWYGNISVNRVQDNYVVQWGDPNYDNPEATGQAKPLPEGLKVMTEAEYTSNLAEWQDRNRQRDKEWKDRREAIPVVAPVERVIYPELHRRDAYAPWVDFYDGWPIASAGQGWEQIWSPIHCYGMVGVGRNLSPDTGTGAELYTVIGHAPRHLDRNIALVGRVIEGMEHLSSLPRGKGELGFYADFEKDKRTPILKVRIASDLHEIPQPAFEYLSTESDSFARYAEARANRRDAFFIHPAGSADICNIPVPVRHVPSE